MQGIAVDVRSDADFELDSGKWELNKQRDSLSIFGELTDETR